MGEGAVGQVAACTAAMGSGRVTGSGKAAGCSVGSLDFRDFFGFLGLDWLDFFFL